MFGLGLMVGALIGFGYALHINEDWYRACIECTKTWFDYVYHIIDELEEEDGDAT